MNDFWSDEWGQIVRREARGLPYPPTPDVASAVMRRLGHTRTRPARPMTLAGAALAVLLAVLVAIPAARMSAARGLVDVIRRLGLEPAPHVSVARPPSRVFVLDEPPGERGLKLRPVNSHSGQSLPGYPAFDLGEWASVRFAADGRTAVAVLFSRSDGLYVQAFDVIHWQAGPRLSIGYTSQVVVQGDDVHIISPDGQWSVFDRAALLYPAPQTSRLADLRPRMSRRLDAGLIAGRVVALDESTLYVFVPWTEPPALAAVRLDTGQIRARLDLPDMAPVQTWVTNGPGFALSPDHTVLYVAHPGQDRVTVVNTDSLTVQQTAHLAPTVGWLDDVLGVRPVEASNYGPGNKLAAVSPDGRWLYIAGWQREATPQSTVRSVGLQIVDARTLRLADQLTPDRTYGKIALSLDGRSLYLLAQDTPPIWELFAGQSVERNATGHLLIVDTRTRAVVLQRPVAGSYGRIDVWVVPVVEE